MLNTVRSWGDRQARERPDAMYLLDPEADLRMGFACLQQARPSATRP